MALQITISQAGKPTTTAGQAREDLALGVAVTLTASGASGSLSWSLHDAPLSEDLSALSTASLSSSSANPTSITPDNTGTYLIRCTSGTETIGITFYAGAALAIIPSNTPRRVPAFDEELEHTVHDAPEPGGNTKGWKRELDRWFAVMTKCDNRLSSVLSANLEAVQYPGFGVRHVAKAEGPTLPADNPVGTGVYTILDIDGAGYLSQISMTISNSALENTRVKIYVDGESIPSIDVAFKDWVCARTTGGLLANTSIMTDRFSSTVKTFGLSFRADFVAPFNTHVKVDIINTSTTTSALLGGFVEYYLGTYNWGLYGKLHAVSQPEAGTSVAPYANLDLVSVTGEAGVFVGGYLHWTPGIGDGYHYQEGDFQVFIDGSGIQSQYDSTEDYYSDGFYMQTITFTTRDIGVTANPGDGSAGAYRFHFRDPIPFTTQFKFQWTNGYNGAFPISNPTIVRGVMWYYTKAAGAIESPTIFKGDLGVPGADGRNQLSVVDHSAVSDTATLWQGNGTLADTATLNYTLSAGTARYMQLIPGCPTRGVYFDGATYLLRDLRSSSLDLVGDMTLQFLLRIFATASVTGATIISYAAPGDTGGDDNALWQVNIAPAASGLNPVLGWFSEHGAGVNDSITSTYMLPLNELMHISIRRSGTNLTFFINGQPADTFTGITLPTVSGSPVQKLRLGADAGATVESSTKFLLASLRIANAARSDAQILADAKACLGWV